MMKRSTHEDCPECGCNLSQYNLKSCESCGFVFVYRTTMPWENQPALDMTQKRERDVALGDVDVNNSTTKRSRTDNNTTDVLCQDVGVNTATEPPKRDNDTTSTKTQQQRSTLKKSTSV